MKTLPLLATFGLLLATLAASAHAQIFVITLPGNPPDRSAELYRPEKQPNYISMSGTAEIKVVPDLVDLQFEVMVRNPEFEAARKDHVARSTKVLTALRAAGVKEADLQASQTKISTVYQQQFNKPNSVIDYYQITQDFGCTLHEVSQVAEVSGAVVSAGATGVGEAKLRTSQLRKYRDEARHRAATAAREKAAALVGEIGQKLGKATGIRENGSSSGMSAQNSVSMNNSTTVLGSGKSDDAGSESGFAPGMISVVAEVDVTYVVEE